MSSRNNPRRQKLGAYVFRCLFIDREKVDYREAILLSGYSETIVREHISRWTRALQATAGRTERMLKNMYEKELRLSSKVCEQEFTAGVERKK